MKYSFEVQLGRRKDMRTAAYHDAAVKSSKHPAQPAQAEKLPSSPLCWQGKRLLTCPENENELERAEERGERCISGCITTKNVA